MPEKLLSFFYELWCVIVNIILTIFLYLMPIQNFISLVIILITIDFFTGIGASVKEAGWESIRASKMKNTVNKILFYSLAIIAAFVLQKIINDGVHFSRITALYIGATELKSIYENVSRITKRDLVSNLWAIAKSYIDSYITKFKDGNNSEVK